MAFYYDSTEKILVEQYIEEQVGPIRHILTEPTRFELSIDLLMVEPSGNRTTQLILTRGLGALPLHVPEFFEQDHRNRVELALAVSPDYTEKSRLDWPIRLLHALARQPLDDTSVLHDLAVLELDDSLVKASGYRAVLLSYCAECHLVEPAIELPRGDRVIFLQVIPLLADELSFIQENSPEDFLRTVYQAFPIMADVSRQSLLTQKDLL